MREIQFPEMVDAFGVLSDGTQTETFKMPMPPEMKFKDILGSYVGRNFEDEDSMESYALYAYREWATWQQKQQAALPPVPIDMVLHCPSCGLQHVDEPSGDWTNPPHRSHLCHGCGHIWRPADVPTNGVKAIQTKGQADSVARECAHHAVWISTDEQLPADDEPVLLLVNGIVYEGMLTWEKPGFEDTWAAYRYFTDYDERCDWEWHDVTHWMPKPALPPDHATAEG